MVFSSFPLYLDHPNLHQFQQPDHHHDQQETGVVETSQLPLQPPPPSGGGGAGGAGSIRPGSMVDRARIAKIPLPEAGVKCPRCDSTNTKFCYFNNYSLSQPRHFCKTCRRYWTRGGAMRSVPVGGGCRRNKRTKSGNSSKSSATTTERHMVNNPTNTASPSRCSTGMAAHFSAPPSQLPLMAAFQNLNDFGGVNLSSNMGGFQTQMLSTNMGFNMGSNNLSGNGAEQWKLPSMGAGYEPSTNLFQFQSEGIETSPSMIGHLQFPSMTNGVSQQASTVKMEDRRELNSSKQFLGTSENNQQWNLNSWTGFSGLSSSSTSHLL